MIAVAGSRTVRPYVALAASGLVLTSILIHAPASAQGTGAAQPGSTARSEQGPTWASLTPAQRGALGPLQVEWPRIDAARKQKWLEVAARMPSMSPPEQKRVQVRMSEWARMTPDERGRARLQFQETRQIAPSERQQRWDAYQSLPTDQRRALAARAAPKPPEAGKSGSKVSKADRPAAGQPPAALAAKKNTVQFLPPATAPKPVGPTVVQSQPGATTSLVTQQGSAPVHHQAGLPKIAATKGFVDPATLLPKRGPQGAAITPAAPEKPASARR